MEQIAHYWFDEANFDPSELIDFMADHTEIPIFAVSLYLCMVFYVPNFVEKPWPLTTAFALWNLLLSVFSTIGVIKVVPTMIHALQTKGFVSTVCANPTEWFLRGPCGLWVALFILSKVPELLDTAFLVLQKKNVMFLHWFHHVTVLLYCWHAYRHRVSTGLWFVSMNYTVHSVMYAYYAVNIFGYSRFARPIAPLITLMQLLQMLMGSVVTAVSAYQHWNFGDCHVKPSNYKLGLGMYISYFILFAILFYQNYLAPNARHRSKKNSNDKNNDKDKICGVDATSLQDSAGLFHGKKESGSSHTASNKQKTK